ncbi:MAG: homocysteine S-methyltransferase [Caldilineaceae bacterium]
MLDSFLPLLEQKRPLILDGALATELERRGANLNDPLWSAKVLIENPEMIRQLHLDYFRAGADITTSATYQATFAGFARRGLDHVQATQLMQLSVQLALEARAIFQSETNQIDETGALPLVAASVGPYGAFLANGAEYTGEYGLTFEELKTFHRERMAVLVASGADLLACETIPSLAEGRALLELLTEFPMARAWLSFSCKDGAYVCHGETMAECATLANGNPQILAIGVNCTAPEHIESLVRIAKATTDKPIVVYPNRGEGYDPVQKCWLPGSESLSPLETARRAYTAGARLIGGCCRTTPEDIREIAEHLTG